MHMSATQRTLAVIGQGYVGLPLAMRAAEQGYRVVGFEVSEARVESLAAGESYVGDISNEQLQAALAKGYLPTHDPARLAGFATGAGHNNEQLGTIGPGDESFGPGHEPAAIDPFSSGGQRAGV